MAKIPLSIKTSYLPTWGMREGVRELVQNARDAEVDGAPMTVEYVNGSLRIENEGTVLPHQALLLGHTTKVGRGEMIGKFGEGLKLGVLALIRAGHSVKIRSGSEVWVPSIEFSSQFGADVLTFDITGGRQDKDRVRIEIGGISTEQWKEIKEGFLFLEKDDGKSRINTYEGTLLLSAKHRGKVYVKGIFVQNLKDASFGYDLKDADLDRDRKMIESWNLQYKTRSVFMAALATRSELFEQFDRMLENQAPELQSIEPFNVSHAVSETVVEHVAQRFVEQHGADAVPVSNLSEAQEVEHFGVRPVIVNRQQGAILQRKLGDIHTLKDRLSKESTKEYLPNDLSDEENGNLRDALAILDPVTGLTADRVHIVDFRSPNMRGQFKDGQVSIARSVLIDPDMTLRVLIHEVAHETGGDGSKSHVSRIEEIWMDVVRNLRRTSRYDRT